MSLFKPAFYTKIEKRKEVYPPSAAPEATRDKGNRMTISVISILIYCRRYLWTGIFTVIFLTACGYHFAGSGSLPGGVKTIGVEMLKNRTTETGLEFTVTNDLIYEFTRRGKAVQKSIKKADAVLSGEIKSSVTTTISRRQQQSPIERQITMTLSLKLTRADGRVIWSDSSISDYEPYKVASTQQGTEINKKNAMRILSKRLAEKVNNRLTENF
jgi:outer membrane lipopolysaccharide assembly protein LptE/RlpB